MTRSFLAYEIPAEDVAPVLPVRSEGAVGLIISGAGANLPADLSDPTLRAFFGGGELVA